MSDHLTRRMFLGAAGTAVATTGAIAAAEGAQETQGAKKFKILGIATSFRKGKTTAGALQICLEAARAVDPERIQIELIELAEMKINPAVAAGVPLAPGERDDFPAVAAKMTDPKVAGIVVATPVYFGNMSSLCKAFLERLNACRKENFALANKVAGVLAVGAARNGGQELTIHSVQTALFGQEMIIVGEGRPGAHSGACLWNNQKDDIQADEVGVATAKALGRRVGEVARRMAGA